uniref:Peptidase M13 C-terminal domain-containing protein n=1 Tax=Romanomermis culicivorax TaxID=13658 RepID=A0A915JDJ5_ROMCU
METKLFNSKLDRVVHDTSNEDDEPNLDINASYGNLIIQMLTGKILPPSYHPNYPLAVKYGDVGWVMGHELLHAFDENGVDEYVPKINHPFFKEDSRKAFNRRTLCLKKQLYSYCFKQKEKCVNGKHTLAETMADVDGLKVAFMAYKFSSLTLAEDPPITGLTDYSSEQIFFMTAGRSYCTSNKNLNEFLDTTEEHAPNQPRIQISIRNFPGRPISAPFSNKISLFSLKNTIFSLRSKGPVTHKTDRRKCK